MYAPQNLKLYITWFTTFLTDLKEIRGVYRGAVYRGVILDSVY